MQITPVSYEAFAAALTACRARSQTTTSSFAVAVSGGPDSMALTLLSKRYAAEHDLTFVALTVDHGLRPESAQEAATVAEWLRDQQIPHQVLHWDHPEAIRGNLQDAARQARYQLLTVACQARGIDTLLVGHHQDDQAETLLHHLVRGSGVDGLAAMPAARMENGVWLLRPLLGFSKESLIAYCQNAQQQWVDDPSNKNPRFARTVLRELLAKFAEQGLTASRVADTATHMGRAQEALNFFTAQAEAECVTHLPAGATHLRIAQWHAYPEDIRLRVLRGILHTWQPHAAKARIASLQALQHRLQNEPSGRHTLGLLLWQWRAGLVQCHLVHNHLPSAAPATTDAIAPWRRLGWEITLPDDVNGLTLAPLGEAGWEFLCAKDRPNVRIARRIAPAAAWQAMPVLWESAYGHLAKPGMLPHIYPAGEPLPLVSPTTGACARFIALWQRPS